MQSAPIAPANERSWDKGAVGEERLGRLLDEHCSQLSVLHDRKIPRSRANIDHIVVAGSAVWVIDAKRYKGQVKLQKPLFGQAKLTVAGRNQAKLLEGLTRQVGVVSDAVAGLGMPVKVRGGLCFLDAEWALFAKPQEMNGLWIGWPKALVKMLNQPGGGLTPEGRHVIARHLAQALPAA